MPRDVSQLALFSGENFNFATRRGEIRTHRLRGLRTRRNEREIFVVRSTPASFECSKLFFTRAEGFDADVLRGSRRQSTRRLGWRRRAVHFSFTTHAILFGRSRALRCLEI